MPISIKERVETKEQMRKCSSEMRNILREKFKAMQTKGAEKGELASIEKQKIGEECKRWVLFILFKTHHLVRTKCREGVCSIHGSE